MKHLDLILLHPPSIYKFRELPIFYGPISDVIPSSSIFENYPIGFLTLSEYLNRYGISVRIVNLAMKTYRIENQLAIEFFHPPPGDFVRKVADSLINFNVEISPESHDPRVRKAFGKTYDNAELEAAYTLTWPRFRPWAPLNFLKFLK